MTLKTEKGENEWDTWYTPKSCAAFPGCIVKIRRSFGDYWIHLLVSPANEPNPRQNHIHVKVYNEITATPVLCGITEDGRKSHSRKNLLDRINEVTGLNLQYK